MILVSMSWTGFNTHEHMTVSTSADLKFALQVLLELIKVLL
jgi:hypothetical protein